MDTATFIAIMSIAAPLIARAFFDWQARAEASHNSAMGRIAGMAGRQAASVARALASMPAGADTATLERSLIAAATNQIQDDMEASAKVVGADHAKLESILQGELDKVRAPPLVAVMAAAAGMVPGGRSSPAIPTTPWPAP